MNTGSILAGRPSLGSWVNYGLGTENSDLPAFVVLTDSERKPLGGVRNWGTGFMPSAYQGTLFSSDGEPVAHILPPQGFGGNRQRNKLDFLARLNGAHAAPREFRSDLEARIRAAELAFRMQAEIPGAVDLANEPEAIRRLYGVDDKTTGSTARNCLLARRLVERGVRFVQIYSGTGSAWDAHANIERNHSERCMAMDQPVAALIKDLKQRGLLESTLVIWGGEFGRTPMSEQGNGRDHNPWGFSMWMAGGGVQGGQALGATDDLGLRAVEKRVHIHDLHATILHAMGLDHRQLHYVHHGRRESPTINTGEVFHEVFG
jgi:membrane-anchored protein YejM (alkaline phosphatase superfamily)